MAKLNDFKKYLNPMTKLSGLNYWVNLMAKLNDLK